MLKVLRQFNIAGARVYVAEFDDGVEVKPVHPSIRNEMIERCADPLVKRQRYCVWQLLDYALKQTVGKGVDGMSFNVDVNGKWSCDGDVNFSLSHSGNLVAVAVCDTPVGIDVERLDTSRFNERLARRILTDGELTLYNNVPPEERPQALVKAWTQKEAIFKRDGGKVFAPNQVDTLINNVNCQNVAFGDGEYIVAVATSN